MHQSSSSALNRQVIEIARYDRWQIYQRLQELGIPCGYLADGKLWVEVQNLTTDLQLNSVLRQFMATRHELVFWLNRCWQISL